MPVPRSEPARWQGQKLQALGHLSAGIAHELSTPLQSLGDTLQFLQDAYTCLRPHLSQGEGADRPVTPGGQTPRQLDTEMAQALDEALAGVARAREIVHAVKTLAHPGTTAQSAADLNRVIEGAIVLAASRIRSVAVVRTDLGALPPVVCQAGQLQQVVLNLLLNAADAIEECPARNGATGRIDVTTSCEGPWATITIRDSGMGIAPDAVPHVFSPFFTTKAAGIGSGQGLAIARAIVEEGHSGAIDFVSEPGRGTAFRIRIPVTGHTQSRRPSRSA